jgi:hypothetical protein
LSSCAIREVGDLVRRLAVAGAQVELEAGRGRREAIEALFAAMDRDGFDVDLEERASCCSQPPSAATSPGAGRCVTS